MHRHVILMNARATTTQVCPDKLCKEICLGIKEQIQRDRNAQYLLANVQMDNNTTSNELLRETKKLKNTHKTIEEEDRCDNEEIWGDVSSAPLEPQEIKRAKREEIEYVHKMTLYDKVFINEAHQQTRKGPISFKWFDIHKGDKECPNYKS